MFADINLSDPDQSIDGHPHNPGSGGWPTIRYFNKKTGIKGGSYRKKTNMHMCQELGNTEILTEYIQDYAELSNTKAEL